MRKRNRLGTFKFASTNGAIASLLAATLMAPLGCGDDDGGSSATGGAASGGVSARGGASSGGVNARGGATNKGGQANLGGTEATAGAGGNAAGAGGSSGGAATSGGQSSAGGAVTNGGQANRGGIGNVNGGTNPGTAGGGAGGSRGDTESGGAGGAGGSNEPFTAAEWTVIHTLSPLPALTADPTNAFADNASAAELGQKFFFEKAFSGPLATLASNAVNDLGNAGESGKVACVSCHSSPQMADSRSPLADGSHPANVSLGADFHSRNAPALVNSSFYTWTNWGGRFSAQWELPLPVSENAVILNSSRLRIAHVIYDKYRTEYEAVFGTLDSGLATTTRFPATGKPKASGGTDGPWETSMTDADRAIVNRIFVNFGKALAAYTRKLVSRNARFDRFVAGDPTALDDSEKRGLSLFIGKAGCVSCHSGPHFSDEGFHNLGVAQTGPHVPTTDDGRYKDAGSLYTAGISAATSPWSDDATTGSAKLASLAPPLSDSLHAAFRTPSLRGVADTAPYMHSGQLASLPDVIDFYARGGDAAAAGSTKDSALHPLTLAVEERADLIHFLGTLTGEAVPAALLVDTSSH